jgi:glycosyltransferase involved in cell wall biosynthesis
MKVYLITLESIETRYTGQWKRWIKDYFDKKGVATVQIDGDTLSAGNLNNKNFLDVCKTNIWKSEQIIKVSKLFHNNKVKDGDIFLFYDAWHYGSVAIKYMLDLNNIQGKIYGIWHAGSYDPNDLLGDYYDHFRTFEKSLFEDIYDKSFVATNYHKELIEENLFIEYPKRIKVTGFPYEFNHLQKFEKEKKEDLVVFPHRLSREKQPEILKDLASNLSEEGIKVIFCQERKLSKEEYHKILAKSKIVFSANLQETWGIGTFEGLYLNCIPVIPDRLSYKEMYYNTFKYPSDWTKSFESYKLHKSELLNFLIEKVKNYNAYKESMYENINFLQEVYCTFDNIYKGVTND